MFSNNQKISNRQLQRLIVLDWIAKAGLLLPRFTERASGRSFMVSLLGGILLTMVYAWMIGYLAHHIDGSFYEYVKERLGQGTAWFISILYFCYAFVNTVYLVRLFAAIAVTFILPETSQGVLIAAVLIGAIYIVSGGLEVRARVGEVLFGIVLYPLLFMLLCAAFSIDSEYLQPGVADFSMQTAKHGLEMFIAFGGMGIFLFITPFLNKKEEMGKVLYRSVMLTCGAVFAIFLTAVGAFGESGMRALPWPGITLMSSAEIPGGFLQRWDVIFTGLLLASFFVSVSTGLFYMRFLAIEVLPKGKKIYLPLLTLLVLAAALWCGSYETAARVFTVLNGYLMVPIAVLFTLFLLVLEYVKRRKKA